MKTLKDIAARVAAEAGLGKDAARAAAGNAVKAMAEFIASGEDVRVAALGTFRKMHVDERQARNPQTGESVTVPAHETVRFKPSASLMEKVNP